MHEISLEHEGPWTEDEYFALDETANRIELIDGGLWVTPSSNGPHNDISLALTVTMKKAARVSGLRARQVLNVRLAPGRLVVPDITVARCPWVVTTVDAADVVLACEVTSPSNAFTDRVSKMRLYAEAKIEWYLLVEPNLTDYDTVTLHLFHLEGDRYVEHATATGGETLVCDLPFPLEIRTDDLLEL